MSLSALAAAAILALAPRFPRAQEPSTEERLRRLEDQLQRQRQELDDLRKAQDEDDGSLTFADGLRFRSKAGEYDIHLGGRYEEQYRHILDRPDSSRTLPNTFFTREAFLQADGVLMKEWGFRVSGNFPSSNPDSAPGATLVTGYVDWRRYREFTLLFGMFKAPISQETAVTSPLFTDPIERSILSRFVPSYEMGIMAYGTIGGGLLGYQAAVTNGRLHLSTSGRARNDDNDAKEFLLRVTTMPWKDDPSPLLHGLRFGLYGSVSDVDDVPMAGTFDIVTPALNVAYLRSSAGFLDGRRTRAGAELSWAVGPGAFRSEYMRRTDEISDGAAVHVRMPIDCWYGQLTWILTGEDKVVETRIVPARPFDLGAGAWGALELIALVSQGVVGKEFEDVGNSLSGQSNRVVTYTTGFNWYPVRSVRIAANVVREDYRRDVAFSGSDSRQALNGFLLRFQVDF